MSVFLFGGFDTFGYGTDPNGFPPRNAGLANNPLNFTMSYASSSTFVSFGVTGLAKNKMGNGANARNSLVMNCFYTSTSAANNTVNSSLPIDWYMPVAGNQLVFGFRMKRTVAQSTQAFAQPVRVGVFGFAGIVILAVASTYVTVSGNNYNYVFNQDQEYYIEIVFTRTGTGSAGNTLQIFIDGVALLPSPVSVAIAVSGALAYYFGGSFGTSSVQMNVQFNIADFYIADRRLGAQMILTREPSLVVESNWKPSEGTNPLAMITGAGAQDDAKYIISPETDAPDKYRMDFDVKAGYKVNGAAMYLRGKRAPASSRNVILQPYDRVSGEDIDKANTVSTLFSQQEWRTDRVWMTDKQESLEVNLINNLNLKLSSPRS